MVHVILNNMCANVTLLKPDVIYKYHTLPWTMGPCQLSHHPDPANGPFIIMTTAPISPKSTNYQIHHLHPYTSISYLLYLAGNLPAPLPAPTLHSPGHKY